MLKRNKKSFLQPSNQITALPYAISRKTKWAQKILRTVQSATPILTNGTLKDRMGPCAST